MKRYFLVFYIFISFLFSCGTPSIVHGTDKKTKKSSDETSRELSKTFYEDLDLFSEVLTLIHDNYVEKVDDKELLYGAIRGMVETLDPHSLFMSSEIYKELKSDTEGKFSGIGLEITLKNNDLIVVTPMEGSPAEKAGIREGDHILKIDGVSAKELGLSEAVQKMRGRRGSHVKLVLSHKDSEKTYEVFLKRKTIKVKSVRAELLEDHFAYVRIASFQKSTAEDLMNLLQKLGSKNRLKGIILDLRNNPGGLLEEAIETANLFLKSGTIVTTLSRNKEINKKSVLQNSAKYEMPLVVLVNGGSASAAEIVAGALQDHKRAILIGTQTFGKGSVQTVFELEKTTALKLTVAKYYTPKGRAIQAEGILPDIVVENTSSSGELYVREKDLKGHLDPESSENFPNSSGKEGDHQKKMAVEYLKSWEIFKGS